MPDQKQPENPVQPRTCGISPTLLPQTYCACQSKALSEQAGLEHTALHFSCGAVYPQSTL